jgi:hypothetical protein
VDGDDVGVADGGGVGNVANVRRRTRCVLAVLLAPTLAIGCGDPALSPGMHDQQPTVTVSGSIDENFPPVANISLVEHGKWCATLKVGGVIAYDMCTHSDSLPTFAYDDMARRLMMLIIDGGETIAFADGGNARLLASTEHWVVAQLSSEMSSTEVRFTLMSQDGVRTCRLTSQLFMRCTP